MKTENKKLILNINSFPTRHGIFQVSMFSMLEARIKYFFFRIKQIFLEVELLMHSLLMYCICVKTVQKKNCQNILQFH